VQHSVILEHYNRMIKITFKGIKQSIKSLEGSVKKEFWALGDFADKSVRKYTAVDTGYARASWNLDKYNNGFTLSNNAPYIGRLDEGWSKQHPRGFTEPTLNAIKRRKRK
jgi:hypothetical protein